MITVICPVKNEEKYIDQLISFFLASLPSDKELFLVDGNSTDNTRSIIEKYCCENPNINLIDNPKGYVPFALNEAINNSTGDPVIRLDAHTKFANDYFVQIINTFEKTNADIVGGPMRAIGSTDFQNAVAYCTSTKFGVGDSSFHDEQKEGYVDSVYLGAFRRSVFNDVGLFDEEMLRNQDDEFNYRAASKGKTIYLNPEIYSEYYPRDSVSKLFKQYFQYGLFKPLVLKKVKSGIRIRHLIPAMFVFFNLFAFIGFSLMPVAFSLIYILYIVLNLYFSMGSGKNILTTWYCFVSYIVLHFSYGLGFILGIFNLQKIFLK